MTERNLFDAARVGTSNFVITMGHALLHLQEKLEASKLYSTTGGGNLCQARSRV